MYSKNLMPRTAEGKSVDDVKEELYKKYGTDYEIIDYKPLVKPGFLHLYEHVVYRVTYLVKDNQFDDLPSGGTGEGRPSSLYPSRPVQSSGVRASFPNSLPQMGSGRFQAETAAPSSVPQAYQSRPASPSGQQAGSADDFAASRKMLLDSLGGADKVTQLSINAMSKKLDSMAVLLSKVSESTTVKDEHETVLKIASLLEQNSFSKTYIEEIKDRIRGEFKLEELEDEQLVMAQVADWIGEDISVAPKFPGKKKPHVIIVVGPTGIGKTTTIAKMAAEIKMSAKGKDRDPVIHMITTDNVRVAAKEQLERYAEVLGLNVDKVDSKEDLESLLSLYVGAKAKGDFVFIDTSGFSPNDYDHISRLQDMLDVRNLKADIYLAVSATTKGSDLDKIFKNYEPFGFRSVIVTKCDETASYGNVLSVLHEKRKSVSWITVGQEVLHTLKRADPVYFVRSLDGFDVDVGHLERKFGQEESSAASGLGE